MRFLLAALTLMTLVRPAFAEDQAEPDMMDWYQEQRQSTVERSLKDEQRYRDRWPTHVKERYNITVENADNTFVPFNQDGGDGQLKAKMDNIPSYNYNPEPEKDLSASDLAGVGTSVSTEEEASPEGWASERAAQETSGATSAEEKPKEGWPSENVPQ